MNQIQKERLAETVAVYTVGGLSGLGGAEITGLLAKQFTDEDLFIYLFKVIGGGAGAFALFFLVKYVIGVGIDIGRS